MPNQLHLILTHAMSPKTTSLFEAHMEGSCLWANNYEGIVMSGVGQKGLGVNVSGVNVKKSYIFDTSHAGRPLVAAKG